MNLSDLNSRKTSTWLIAGIGLVFLIIIMINQISNRPTAYSQQVLQQRAQKNLQFKNDPQSPIKREDKVLFEELNYFPVRDEYRVEASFVQESSPDTLNLMTTTGEDRLMVRSGQLHFQLQGQNHSLLAYRYLDPGKTEFFVPFKDLTSGVATYGGGRYLDVPSDNPIVLDFNQAYNPYCVYNETFSCPLPPRENYLPLEVRSGEMKFSLAANSSASGSD